MSVHKRSYNNNQIDSDQKDLAIAQLKAEIFELRQNERDYVELAAQLRNLEHRYNLLQEDKFRGEADFKARNEQNFRTIANLKTDIDTLKSTISETQIEYQELKAESAAIKDIAETRSMDISQLRNEQEDANTASTILNEDVRNLQMANSIAREDKRKILNHIDHANADVDELTYRNTELEKVIKEIGYEKDTVEKENDSVQRTIDTLYHELQNREDNLRQTDAVVLESQKNIADLESDIQELEKINERGRSELLHQQRNHQSEVTRNLELNAKIGSLDSGLRAREIQAEDLKREIDNLKHAHNTALDGNFQLTKDSDNLRHSINVLTNQNAELVDELSAFNEEDERIRAALNRRNRVQELKVRSDTALKQSSRALNDAHTTNTSPKKTRPLNLSSSLGASIRRSPTKY